MCVFRIVPMPSHRWQLYAYQITPPPPHTQRTSTPTPTPIPPPHQPQPHPIPNGENDSHFADDIFGCVFVKEVFYILMKILLQFVP